MVEEEVAEVVVEVVVTEAAEEEVEEEVVVATEADTTSQGVWTIIKDMDGIGGGGSQEMSIVGLIFYTFV